MLLVLVVVVWGAECEILSLSCSRKLSFFFLFLEAILVFFFDSKFLTVRNWGNENNSSTKHIAPAAISKAGERIPDFS